MSLIIALLVVMFGATGSIVLIIKKLVLHLPAQRSADLLRATVARSVMVVKWATDW